LRDLNDLNFFAAVVANGGISAASRALGLPKSRISRRVTALEDQLGVRLLERSTRRFKITEAGEDVYRHARAALSEAEAIDEAVSRLKAEPQGLVRVSCPLGIDRLLAATLQDFLAKHPKLRLQFVVTNRRVDVIEDGIDIAIRIRERLDSDADLQVKIVGRTHAILVASPAFVAAKGQPATPSEIGQFQTVGLTDRAAPDRWRLSNDAGDEVEVSHEPRLASAASPSCGRRRSTAWASPCFPSACAAACSRAANWCTSSPNGGSGRERCTSSSPPAAACCRASARRSTS
jgi:DNA-binding transcriptional LysR family regulator